MDWKTESAVLRKSAGHENYEPLHPFVSKRTVDRSIWYEGQLVTVYAQGERSTTRSVSGKATFPKTSDRRRTFITTNTNCSSSSTAASGLGLRVCRWTCRGFADIHAGRAHTLVRVDVAGDAHAVVHGHREQGIPSINNSTALFKFIGIPAEAVTLPPRVEVKQMPDPVEIARVTVKLAATSRTSSGSAGAGAMARTTPRSIRPRRTDRRVELPVPAAAHPCAGSQPR